MNSFYVNSCINFEDFISKLKRLPEGEFWIFRGHRESKWFLETTFERSCRRFGVIGEDRIRVERNMIREFQRRLHHYTANIPPMDSTDEWLALMQHYGAPTRLLDFTYSPYVAAYFAFENAYPNSEVAIWAINFEWCEDMVKSEYNNLYEAYLEYRETREGKYFNTIFMPEKPDKPKEFLLAVNPFRLNERLAYHRGVFLCPGNVTVGFMDNLSAYTENKKPKENIIQFTIQTGSKNENTIQTLNLLDLMNIGRITLFPGLDGFAQSFAPRIHPLFLRQY